MIVLRFDLGPRIQNIQTTNNQTADNQAMRDGTEMAEKDSRQTSERDEIAARVAAFRDTQEKFQRERDEFFVSTMQSTRRPSLWP